MHYRVKPLPLERTSTHGIPARNEGSQLRMSAIENIFPVSRLSQQANAQTEKDAAVGRLQSDLREQAARSTRELHDIRVAFAREKDAAVAAAVSSAVSNLTVQLETAREKVIAALKTKLEVIRTSLVVHLKTRALRNRE